MKKLLFFLLPFISIAQVEYSHPIPISFTEDKELSKYIFNYINSYRDSIGVKPYIWTEFWYRSAKKWNDYCATNGKWGHNRGPEWTDWNGEELIVAVPVLPGDEGNFKVIADSAVRRWLNSPWHNCGIVCPRMEKFGDTSSQQFGSHTLDKVFLCRYAAISANVLQFEDHQIVYIVYQKGFYEDSAKMYPSAFW